MKSCRSSCKASLKLLPTSLIQKKINASEIRAQCCGRLISTHVVSISLNKSLPMYIACLTTYMPAGSPWNGGILSASSCFQNVNGNFGPFLLFMALRLVTFDALHTIITPRLPIHVQYSQTFSPYLGNLNPDSIKRSFKVGTSKTCLLDHIDYLLLTALKDIQEENPLFSVGAQTWWREVIWRTALGAGADEQGKSPSMRVRTTCL